MKRRKKYKRKAKKCVYCSRKLRGDNFTLDHYIPKSKGGGNSPRPNLLACCKVCNKYKRDMHPHEWHKFLEGKRRQFQEIGTIQGFNISPEGSFIKQ